MGISILLLICLIVGDGIRKGNHCDVDEESSDFCMAY